jgi:hypothetical protein
VIAASDHVQRDTGRHGFCVFAAHCVLSAANRGAYLELPDEIQLLWYKALDHEQSRAG